MSRQKEEDKSLRYGDSVFETLQSIEITDIRARVLRGKKVELIRRPLCLAVSASTISAPSLYKKFYDTTHFILSGAVEARAHLLEEKERSIFMQFLLVSLKLFSWCKWRTHRRHFILSPTSVFDGIPDQEKVTSRKQHAGDSKQVRISSWIISLLWEA